MTAVKRDMNADDLLVLQAIADMQPVTKLRLLRDNPSLNGKWDSARYFLHDRGLISSTGQKRGTTWTLTSIGRAVIGVREARETPPVLQPQPRMSVNNTTNPPHSFVPGPAFRRSLEHHNLTNFSKVEEYTSPPSPFNPNMNRANEHFPIASDEQLEAMIVETAQHIGKIMEVMGIDVVNDHNSKDSPMRIAKAWIKDTMRGRFGEEPRITSFPNAAGHSQMILSGPIRVVSLCSHHWAPFIGEAYVAYIPGKTVVGLSKLSRVVDFYARRPQIQEELTQQIADHVDTVIGGNLGVAVMIRSAHQCMTCRGVEDPGAKMTTSELRGAFFDKPEARQEFFDLCRDSRSGN